MFACYVYKEGRKVYSSFFRTKEEAIEYAKKMPGVMGVEKAHARESPVWERKD